MTQCKALSGVLLILSARTLTHLVYQQGCVILGQAWHRQTTGSRQCAEADKRVGGSCKAQRVHSPQ